MPRTARIAFENAFYHIFNRGLNRELIFKKPEDYLFFLNKIQQLNTKKGYDHLIFAYCLMPNHFHFLIQTRKTPISKIMSSLITSYSMFFNRKYGRLGPLLQDRFKSKLCSKETYFLGASRYIHLNPLVARLVNKIDDYPWSSYQDLFGLPQVRIIEKEAVSQLIGETISGKKSYQEFLVAGIKNYPKFEKEYNFDHDIGGPALFNSLTQKKFLRRKTR